MNATASAVAEKDKRLEPSAQQQRPQPKASQAGQEEECPCADDSAH